MIDAGSPEASAVLVGVDVGGTFTDAVVVHGGDLHLAKVPTTPADQSEGVLAGVLAALSLAGLEAGAVDRFAQGMTVGTNALLEGRGARTALVATAGFGDVLELRRQDRADLYRLDVDHAPPLIPPERVVEVSERVTPDGVLTPLTDEEIARVSEAVGALGVEAVAIGLLFSFAHPEHEQALAAAIRSAHPALAVSASHEVLAEIREYERISTTAVDAYLTPTIADYLGRLGERSRAAGLAPPAIMQSSGGVLDIGDASAHCAWTVLSGPAGGVIAAARLAGALGLEEALTLDMGGTSCDVALIRDGRPDRAAGAEIAGYHLSLPMLDVSTVSAGGGSIAWRDSGGALRVGPRSAGARPGPAAYGRGGAEPTVTDANVVLGRIPLEEPLGGAVSLSPDRARTAVGGLAKALGLGLEECARGILRVAVEEMVRALRRVSVERGVDPRGATLFAFGGAGPLHACDVADALGARGIVVPAAAGAFAALGLVQAGTRRDWVQTILRRLDAATERDLEDDVAALVSEAQRSVPGAPLELAADCRYLGQSHSLTVPWDRDRPLADLIEAFHAAHEHHYGRASRGEVVEVVSLRVAAAEPGVTPVIADTDSSAAAAGPSVVEVDGATLWVASGWRSRPGPSGSVIVSRTGGDAWTP